MRILLLLATIMTLIVEKGYSTRFFAQLLHESPVHPCLEAKLLGFLGCIPGLGIIPSALGASADFCPLFIGSLLALAQIGTIYAISRPGILGESAQNVFLGFKLRRGRASFFKAHMVLLAVIFPTILFEGILITSGLDGCLSTACLILALIIYGFGSFLLNLQRAHDLGIRAWQFIAIMFVASLCAAIFHPLQVLLTILFWGILFSVPGTSTGVIRYSHA